MTPEIVARTYGACDTWLSHLVRDVAGAGPSSPLRDPTSSAELVLVASVLDATPLLATPLTRALLRLGAARVHGRAGSRRRHDIVLAGALGHDDDELVRWLGDHWWQGDTPIETAERVWARARLGDADRTPLLATVRHLTRGPARPMSAAEAFQLTHLFLYATDFGRARGPTLELRHAAGWLRALAGALPRDAVDVVAEVQACRLAVDDAPDAAVSDFADWLGARGWPSAVIDDGPGPAQFHQVVTVWLAAGTAVRRAEEG